MKKLTINEMEFSFKCEKCGQPLYLWSGLCHTKDCELSLQNKKNPK